MVLYRVGDCGSGHCWGLRVLGLCPWCVRDLGPCLGSDARATLHAWSLCDSAISWLTAWCYMHRVERLIDIFTVACCLGSLLFVVTNVRYLCLICLYSALGAIRELRGGLGALS